MSWIPPSGSTDWLRRTSLSYIHNGTDTEALLDLVDARDYFWTAAELASSGFDLRITEDDGKTLVAFERISFDTTAKTGSLRLDISGTSPSNNVVTQFFLYFSAETTPADGSTTVTASAVGTAFTQPGYLATSNVIPITPEAFGATRPLIDIQKGVGETVFAWWDVARLLLPFSVRVTRLARGLPVGGDLEYADSITLARALEGRQPF